MLFIFWTAAANRILLWTCWSYRLIWRCIGLGQRCCFFSMKLSSSSYTTDSEPSTSQTTTQSEHTQSIKESQSPQVGSTALSKKRGTDRMHGVKKSGHISQPCRTSSLSICHSFSFRYHVIHKLWKVAWEWWQKHLHKFMEWMPEARIKSREMTPSFKSNQYFHVSETAAATVSSSCLERSPSIKKLKMTAHRGFH